jgi:hypothetical protein
VSDTPRTDAVATVQVDGATWRNDPAVIADFARELERENADLRERLNELLSDQPEREKLERLKA